MATPKRTDLDFEEFHKLLEAERANLLNLHHRQRADMEEEARDVSENELSTGDWNEPADYASALVDRDRDKAQDVEIMAEIHEIEKALDRIADGTYGLDIVSGKPIPIERLRVIPWASMTVEGAESGLDYGYSTEA
jgi:DnaK suppressor protein